MIKIESNNFNDGYCKVQLFSAPFILRAIPIYWT